MLPTEKVPLTLLFDLDGTLVHSAPDLRVAVNKVLAEHGRRPLSEPEVMGMVGNGARKLMERAWDATGAPAGEALDTLLDRFMHHYMEAPAALTRPFEGVVETLETLRAAGYRMAVVTNKPQAPTEQAMAALDLTRHFDTIVGGGATPHLKPHPAPLQEALDRMGATAAGAVMVGDSQNDTEAAQALGVPSVCVTFGYRRCSLEDLGADLLIERFADLPEALARLAERRAAIS